MNISQLQELGFSESLAKAYLFLLAHGSTTPPALGQQIQESRTNSYSLLDKLVQLGLASKDGAQKKITYRAEHPIALEKLIQQQRDEALNREKAVQNALPELMNIYQINHEKPGVRFYEGKKGIEKIFREQLKEKNIRFLRTKADIPFFGFEFMHKMRNLAPKAGIEREAFTPKSTIDVADHITSDKAMLLTRTWYNPDDYTAPVEWSVFGNKVSIISFGQEAIGMVIDSPQIAAALRQMFNLMEEGLRRRPDYNASPTTTPETIKRLSKNYPHLKDFKTDK